jgi:hypothetical protein
MPTCRRRYHPHTKFVFSLGIPTMRVAWKWYCGGRAIDPDSAHAPHFDGNTPKWDGSPSRYEIKAARPGQTPRGTDTLVPPPEPVQQAHLATLRSACATFLLLSITPLRCVPETSSCAPAHAAPQPGPILPLQVQMCIITLLWRTAVAFSLLRRPDGRHNALWHACTWYGQRGGSGGFWGRRAMFCNGSFKRKGTSEQPFGGSGLRCASSDWRVLP